MRVATAARIDVAALALEIRKLAPDPNLTPDELAKALAPLIARQIDARMPAAAADEKALRDALYRALAASRGHRDCLFRSDGDVIEQFLARVPGPLTR